MSFFDCCRHSACLSLALLEVIARDAPARRGRGEGPPRPDAPGALSPTTLPASLVGEPVGSQAHGWRSAYGRSGSH